MYPDYYGQGQAMQMDMADGVMDGTYYGARVTANPGNELRLDAMDRRIDGRIHGQPIVSATSAQSSWASPSYGYTGYGYGPTPQQQAARLDAMDGRMDGMIYGRPITATPQSASRLDAMDGRMDGRIYGQPIVSATPYTYTY